MSLHAHIYIYICLYMYTFIHVDTIVCIYIYIYVYMLARGGLRVPSRSRSSILRWTKQSSHRTTILSGVAALGGQEIAKAEIPA